MGGGGGRVLDIKRVDLRRRAFFLLGGLGLLNALVWLGAFSLFSGHPLLMGAAALAYGLGLRHALDADHIAVIDNVTRASLREQRSAQAAGLFFSLGHSTIVCLATLGVVLAGQRYRASLADIAARGGLIGGWVSILFLVLIAVINGLTLRDLWGQRGQIVSGSEGTLPSRGIARLVAPVLARVSVSWHLYPIGFLFGLGFDTASEISLLGISIAQGERGLPPWEIMMLPLLFVSAMALLDTVDSVLMQGLYSRAGQRARLNLGLTLVSVLLALSIAGVELVSMLSDHLSLSGPASVAAEFVSSHFEMIGALVFALSVFSWLWLRLTRVQAPLTDAALSDPLFGITGKDR